MGLTHEEDHDATEHDGELARLSHRVGDRNDLDKRRMSTLKSTCFTLLVAYQTDTFKGEDRRSDIKEPLSVNRPLNQACFPHPMRSGKLFGLKRATSAMPLWAITATSFEAIYTKPTRINASATSAVQLNFARSRMRESGRSTMACAKIKYWIGISVLQFVTARTNA